MVYLREHVPINLNIGCTIAQNIIGIETFGSWGSNGHKLVKEIGKKVMEETGKNSLPFSSSNLFQLQYKREMPVASLHHSTSFGRPR